MQRFQKVQCIGTGAYSVVYKGIDKSTQQTVAIKEISHKNIDINQILSRQVRILRKLNHPNIIKLLQCYGDANSTFLIFEYIPFDLITFYKKFYTQNQRNLNDNEITYIFYQISQALVYMHTQNFMHRDIKPQNILIDPKTLHIKIIDFGFATESKVYGDNTNYMVTRWYRSLQIVLNLPYDFRADVFALGAMMLELYLGQEIFKSSSNMDQLYWICSICGVPTWQPAVDKMKKLGVFINANEPKLYKMTKGLRPQASNIIISMLQSSPITRISSFQLVKHPYFSKFQIEWSRKKRLQSNYEETRISMNAKTNPQNSLVYQPPIQKVEHKTPRINHINSQPYLHARSLSEKDTFILKQVSLSKHKNENPINFNNKNFNNKHLRTQTCDLHANKKLQPQHQKNIRNTMESQEKNLSVEKAANIKKRTKSLNQGLNLISAKKNLKSKYIENKNVNEIKKTNQPPVFSKIKDKLIETNRDHKHKNKISLSERPQFGQKKLKLLK